MNIPSLLLRLAPALVRDAWPTVALTSVALMLGAWELTRQGGPKRKDLLIVALGFLGLSFIFIVGYLAGDARYHALK